MIIETSVRERFCLLVSASWSRNGRAGIVCNRHQQTHFQSPGSLISFRLIKYFCFVTFSLHLSTPPPPLGKRMLFKQNSDEIELSNNVSTPSSETSTHVTTTTTATANMNPSARNSLFAPFGSESMLMRLYPKYLGAKTTTNPATTTTTPSGETTATRQVIKEGLVNYISIDNTAFDGKHKWEKCRLVLVKSTGDSMLEFYSPIKSFKPKCGIFCFLINEARETMPLEMPDREYTFVLKVRLTLLQCWL